MNFEVIRGRASPLSFLNMGIKFKSGHDFSNLSNLNVMDSKQLPAMRITTYCK